MWILGATAWHLLDSTNVETLRQNGLSTHAQALGFQRMVGHVAPKSLDSCNEVTNHQGSWEDIDVILTPLPKGFIREAMRIINVDCYVPLFGAIPERGWEEGVICHKVGESPPTPAASNS